MKNKEFADIVERNINEIVENWAAAVRSDETILSANDLSEGGLRDHIPGVLEEICELLRSGEHLQIHNTREARVSAYTRFKMDYRAQDLVAEISIFRITLLDFLNENLLNPELNLKLTDYLRAARQIHLYIDEELRYSISIFSEHIAKENNSGSV